MPSRTLSPDTRTTVTLVNLSESQLRTVIVQGGAYGEHHIVSVAHGSGTTAIGAPAFTVDLAPRSGGRLVLTMKRYANAPSARQPY